MVQIRIGPSRPLLGDQFLLSASLKWWDIGAPGWLSRLSIRLRLRSRAHSSWVQAPRRALCWRLGAWSLLWILSPFLSAPPPLTLYLSSKTKKKKKNWGACVAQLVGRPTSAQVMISQSMSSSPASGSVLTAQSLEPVSDSVSPSLSDLPPFMLSLPVSKINKR